MPPSPVGAPPLVKHTFFITYLLLFGTALVTFIEALRTGSRDARHILNLDTAVSLVAGFVYGLFVDLSRRPDFNLQEITPVRYVDWFITTPLLLLIILLFFNYYNKETLHVSDFAIVIFLNYLMLGFGYLGEIGYLAKPTANALGFIAFFAMLAYIYTHFVHGAVQRHLLAVFIAFSLIWAAYGIVALMPDVEKNVGYNILDTISKVFLGLFMWTYYGKVLTI